MGQDYSPGIALNGYWSERKWRDAQMGEQEEHCFRTHTSGTEVLPEYQIPCHNPEQSSPCLSQVLAVRE